MTAAEVRNTMMIAHHNAALCLADHIGPMQRKNFPDSKIAQNYHCARTKTACILNYSIAPLLRDELVAQMKVEPFSLSVDASSDTGLSKMNPLTVRIHDVTSKVVLQKFFDLCLTTGVTASTAATIFDKINATLQQYEISWDNCTAFGVDNTNTNIGAKNSIKSRVTGINPSVYFVGCQCHIIHNAAQKAAEAFGDMSQFDIEECCIDHFYWFDKSTKRKGQLEEYSSFCDTMCRGFIKHINVRWLSVHKAVERILQFFSASRSYFSSENMQDARFKRLAELYKNPMFEIRLLFFQAALPAFDHFNLFLQRDAPQIYILHRQTMQLLTKFFSKFLKASVIQEYKDRLSEVPFSEKNNQIEDSKLFIGIVTSSEIRKSLESGEITDQDVKKFYLSVRHFYTTAVSYIIKWFPLNDDVVKDSQFVDFEVKEQCDFTMVCTFVKRYPKLLNFTNTELDKLNEEFLDYQALPKDAIPQTVWDNAVCYEVGEGDQKKTYHRMDAIWSYLVKMKIPGMDIYRFSKLGRVAK